MFMIFMKILQLDCYAVTELLPSRNPLHTCIIRFIIVFPKNILIRTFGSIS